MGAPEDERVHIGRQDGLERGARDLEHLRTGGGARFDQLDEPRAGLRREGDAGGDRERVVIGAGLDGRLGADDTHPTGPRRRGSPSRRWQDHLDDGEPAPLGVALAGVTKDSSGRRVARDDEHLDAGVHEVVHDLQSVRTDSRQGLGPVRRVGGVADVQHGLVGQLVQHRAGDGQPADPRVEDPDRGVIHGAEPNGARGRLT